jgi:hypothetical protein
LFGNAIGPPRDFLPRGGKGHGAQDFIIGPGPILIARAVAAAEVQQETLT